MAEAAGWIVAVLVAVVAVLARCLERAHSRRAGGASGSPTDSIVSAQRTAIMNAAESNLDRIADDLDGDDPEGGIANASNAARSDR